VYSLAAAVELAREWHTEPSLESEPTVQRPPVTIYLSQEFAMRAPRSLLPSQTSLTSQFTLLGAPWAAVSEPCRNRLQLHPHYGTAYIPIWYRKLGTGNLVQETWYRKRLIGCAGRHHRFLSLIDGFQRRIADTSPKVAICYVYIVHRNVGSYLLVFRAHVTNAAAVVGTRHK
jgi:hypothetical protein